MYQRILDSSTRLVGLLLAACLLIGGAAALRPAASLAADVDVSKLKPGDKVGVQLGGAWFDAVFVKKISANLVRVKRTDNGHELTTRIDDLRPSKRNAAKSKKLGEGEENPFATEDEKAANRKPRTWTERSGKFSVEATLLRVDDDQVVLRRKSDEKEVKVPLDKLSDADRKYVAEITGSPAEDETEDSQTDIAITPTDFARARSINLAAEIPWSYQPDPAAKQPKLAPARVVLSRGPGKFDPVRLISMPGESKLYVVERDSLTDFHSVVSRVQLCNLRSGKVESMGVFGTNITPIDVSADGSLVLARSDGRTGLDRTSELRIYSLKGEKVEPISAWLPYGHHASPFSREKGNRPSLDVKAGVVWARFVDSQHVATLSQANEFAVWQVPKIAPAYTADCDMGAAAAISAGQKYIALAYKQGIAIIDAARGKPAGLIEASLEGFVNNMLAFRPDGKQLALVQGGGRVRVWDLEKRELIRDFAISAAQLADAELDWIDDTHLLVGGTAVVDVSRRLVVWTYPRTAHFASQVVGSQVCSLERNLARGDFALSLSGPPKAALDAVKDLRDEDLLVIRPGMEVTVDLQAAGPDAESTRQAVVAKLTEEGMKVVPDSKVRLVGNIRPGESKTIQYRPFGARHAVNPNITQHQMTEQILTLSWMVDNNVVWKYESHTFPPHILRRNANESVDQALARTMKLDPASFARILVPVYVALAPNSKEAQASLPAK